MKLPVRRIIAWCIDWVCILGWVAVTAAVGIPLYANGLIHLNDTAQENIVGAAVIVVLIVVAAAVCESRSKPSTPGKRMMHLQVRTGSARPNFLRALARNSLKLGVPWLIGHTAVYAISSATADGTTPTAVWVLIAAAYAIPLVYVVALFVADGRTPYDRICSTAVTATPPASETRVL